MLVWCLLQLGSAVRQLTISLAGIRERISWVERNLQSTVSWLSRA